MSERGSAVPPWRRHILRTAFAATLGAGTGLGLLLALRRIEQIVLLVALSLLLAIGLDLPVGWLVRRGLQRRWALLVVLFGSLAATVGVLVAVATPVVAQVRALLHHLPAYLSELRHHNGPVGRLVTRLHLQNLVSGLLHGRSGGSGSAAVTGLVGVGETLLSAVGATVLVVALTAYLVAGLPRLRENTYRLVPASRRDRAAELGDEVLRRVGGYVLGNLVTSLVAGLGTLVWLLVLHVPFPLALSLFVAVLDLVPVVGSTVAGALVTLVALTVSVPVGAATLGYYVIYRLLEDYLLVPRVMRRTVDVSPLVTVLALLIGGTLLGIIGALLAVPAAAAAQLLVAEIALPKLEEM